MTELSQGADLNLFLEHPDRITNHIQQEIIRTCREHKIYFIPSEIIIQCRYKYAIFDLRKFYENVRKLEDTILQIFVIESRVREYYKVVTRHFRKFTDTPKEISIPEVIRIQLIWHVDQVTSKLLLEDK